MSDPKDPIAAMLNPMQMGGPMMPGGPSLQPLPSAENVDDDIVLDDDDLEETLSERLLGLTEMFPETLRTFTGNVVSYSWSTSKAMYSLGCSGMWVLASSAAILALPVMFETERAQMEEQQMQQQRQILLGPNAAVSGQPGPGPMAVPQPR